MASAPGNSRDDALAFLFGRIDYERALAMPYGIRDFRLDRMRELLARLGQPSAGLPIVHVAGTKGKGSVAAMVASVLSAGGYRTGLFSSPHLNSVEERVRIDGRPCSPEELAALIQRIRPLAEAMDREHAGDRSRPGGPTYFELTTALALLHFADRRVDVGVLEVGLGGRLDSTNVCTPAVSVITSISFDHTRQLGNTLGEIAWEKAGIVKPGVPVISGVLDDEPRQVIENVCRQRQSPLVQLGVDFEFDYRPPAGLEHQDTPGVVDFRYLMPGRQHAFAELPLGLLGRHQATNAAVCLATLAELARQGWTLEEAAVRQGLRDLTWPARVELVARRPAVILDAAHNVASIEALLQALDESFTPRRRILVFATTRDKDASGMLQRLLPRFDEVVFTQYTHNPRALPAEELNALSVGLTGRGRPICPDAGTAWDLARSLAGGEDLICITGSFFLAAEIRPHLEARPANGSPPIAVMPAGSATTPG